MRGRRCITNNKECPYAVKESNINHLPLRQVEDMKGYVSFPVPKFLMLDDGDYLVTVEPRVKAAMAGISVSTVQSHFSWRLCQRELTRPSLWGGF